MGALPKHKCTKAMMSKLWEGLDIGKVTKFTVPSLLQATQNVVKIALS